jgi:CDP-glucose 4,6-dehydratase
MGGHDPYSASKGAAELVIQSYRRSFFNEGFPAIASARAGNVIGGGDWASNRIVPDIIRSLEAGIAVEVRHPKAIRPWQHVLEPLGGYLKLGLKLLEDPSFAEGWNFGPHTSEVHSVEELVVETIRTFGKGSWNDISDSSQPHEAKLLALDISKARIRLNWQPVLSFRETVEKTAAWYSRSFRETDMRAFTLEQIQSYESEWKSLNIK